MKDRSTLLHGGLAAAAAALALGAWLRPGGVGEAEEVELISGEPGALTELAWSDGEVDLTLARAGEGLQVAVTAKAAVAGTAQASAAPPVAAPAKTRVYPASDAARKLLENLVPLRVSRDLGAVEGERLAAFGLAEPTAKLKLRFGHEEHALDVGGTTFGGGNTYVRAAGGRVYLLMTSRFSDLRNGGSALTERRLVTVPRGAIERVVVASGGKRRELVQRHGDDPATAFFADPADPDARLDAATAWLERILRARMSDFAERTPAEAPAVTVELLGEKGAVGHVRLWRPAGADAVLESSAFPSPVTVPKALAESLVADADAAVGE